MNNKFRDLVLVLVLCLASVEFSLGRLIPQSLEPWNQEAVIASDKGAVADIVYEPGYEVTTILDGYKSNISIYSTYPIPGAEYIYAIDMHASEILKLKLPIAQSTQIGHFAGSDEGEAGHKDGWGGASLFNHPKGLTVDNEKNLYIADVRDSVIRKVTPEGIVSTIAGLSNVSGFADGEGRNALLSSDFDISYISKMCSLLVSDRGNKKLRLIRLKRPEDCGSAGFKNWKLKERLIRLQMILRDSWLGRGRVDNVHSPMLNGGPARLPLHTSSLPPKLVIPDLMDLSVDLPSAVQDPHGPALTENPHYNRGANGSSEISEETVTYTQSAPAALTTKAIEEVGNQRLGLQDSGNAQSQLRLSGLI